MRSSQSFSDAESVLYGHGSASTPSSFEDPAPIRSGLRRASIATPNVRGLDLDHGQGGRSSASPASVRPVPHRSVTFSTPKPEEFPPKKHRNQGPYGPRGTIPNQNTTLPTQYPENVKGLPISSRRGPSDDGSRRGLATIAAPPRDLPPTLDPTYTGMGPNKRPLPLTHQSTPPLAQQHIRKEGQQLKQPNTTRSVPLQPVNAPLINETRSQARSTVSANVPIVAPQPVNPIRPWKWDGKA